MKYLTTYLDDEINFKFGNNGSIIELKAVDDHTVMSFSNEEKLLIRIKNEESYIKTVPVTAERKIIQLPTKLLKDLTVGQYDVELWQGEGDDQVIYPDEGFLRLKIHGNASQIDGSLVSSITLADFEKKFNGLAQKIEDKLEKLPDIDGKNISIDVKVVDGNLCINGKDTGINLTAKDGRDGRDGHTPEITVSDAGTLVVDGIDTNKSLIGPRGENGLPGKDGVAGQDGKSAYQVAVDNGFDGTEVEWLRSLHGNDGLDGKSGRDGLPGQSGKSAYEIAITNGFTGTETEWLESLKGRDGHDGKDANVDLSKYPTKDEIANQYVQRTDLPNIVLDTDQRTLIINNKEIKIPNSIDLSNYAQKSEIPNIVFDVENNMLTINGNEVKIPKDVDLSVYYTKADIDEKIATVQSGGKIDLSNYVTQQELSEYVKKTDIPVVPDLAPYETKENAERTYATKEEVANIQLTPGKNGLSAYELAKKDGFHGTEIEWLASLKGKDGRDGSDAHVDLSDFLTKETANSEYAKKNDVPLIVYDAESNTLTINGQKVEIPSQVDLSSYVTKTDADNYALKSDVKNIVFDKDKRTLTVGKESIDIPNNIDLSPYYTKEEIDKKLTDIVTNGKVDLTGYLRQSDLEDYAKKSDIPSQPDLTPYVKKTELPQVSIDIEKRTITLNGNTIDIPSSVDLADYAKKSEIPSIVLDSETSTLTINGTKVTIPASVDLSPYYTKSEIDEKLADIQSGGKIDLSSYATKEELNKIQLTPGKDGKSAYREWLDQGNTGTEQDFLNSLKGENGKDGTNGLSAYEIAQKNGFNGNEQEWLHSLKGQDGKDGSQGPRGEQGVQGLPGKDGINGKDGKSAYQVATDNGFDGTEAEWLASLKGKDGMQGPQGPVGPKGNDLVNNPKTLYFSDFNNGELLADLENGSYYLSLEASQMPLDAPQGNNGYAILNVTNANSYNGKQVLTDISGKSWTRVKASGFFKPWQDNSFSNKLRLTSDDGTNFFLTLSNSGEISTRKDLTDVVGSPDFDYQWGYSGDDLGAVFSKESTKFSVWSPIAESVSLVLYKDLNPGSEVDRIIEMKRGKISNPDNHLVNNVGVFSVEVEEDFSLGKAYKYRLTFPNGIVNETQDIYSTAVTKGGDRSVVIDPSSLVPSNFNVGYSGRANLPSEVIVGETSVRDFTFNVNSGVDENKRGKYLGMIQEGTKNPNNNKSTGFDYIKDLGLNYIQLMPIFDSYAISEENWSKYNWGYDPKNYNVPETAYATDSLDPKTPIIELKQMISKFHENNIGVVMDVVFNHIGGGDANKSSFGKTVPGYYFRLNDDGSFVNGSFCGNDIATEHEMMRKFIVDSIKYWINNYGIDGFRFDLMGIIDTDTSKLIEDEVKKIDSKILLYGEGWNMPTKLEDSKKTMQSNANQFSNIGFFNDNFRDSVGGNKDFTSPGFLSGKNNEEMIVNSMKGGQFGNSKYTRASQVVQYLECHDDYTLTDKLWKYNPSDSPDIHGKRISLGLGMLFASQGITFIQIGQEFWRNKQGLDNTFESPDSINDINWDYIGYHPDTIDLTKQLINLKKSNGLFRLDMYNYINEHLTFQNYKNGTGVISFTLKDDTAKFILFFNSSGSQIEIGKDSNSNLNGIYTYSDVDFSYAVSNISNSINVSGGKVIIDNLGFAIFKFNS